MIRRHHTISILILLLVLIAAPVSATVSATPRNVYKFDTLANPNPDTLGNNNINLDSGNSITTNFKFLGASAINFSGVNAASTAATLTSYQLPTTGCVNLWVYKNDTSQGEVLFQTGQFDFQCSNPDGNTSHNIYLARTKADAFLRAAPQNQHTGTCAVAGTWTMLTYCWATNNRSIYLNGTLWNTSATSTAPDASGTFNMGYASGIPWKGAMDEFTIFNTTLSQADVTALYNNGAGVQYPWLGNSTPSLSSVTLTASANNSTLIASANATDADTSDGITYFYTFFNNSIAFLTGSSGQYTQGITVNFANATTALNGTYTVQVIASDGQANTSSTNATNLTITFPANHAPIVYSLLLNIADITLNNTLRMFGQYNDTDNNSQITAYYNIYRDDVLFNSGSVSGLSPYTYYQFANQTITQNGTYVLESWGNDGTEDGVKVNTTSVTVTQVPSTTPAAPSALSGLLLYVGGALILLVVLIMWLALAEALNIKHNQFYVIGAIVIITIIAVVFFIIRSYL